MPMNSVLVNLARGEVVNTEGVLTALSNGRLFDAALDVLRFESANEEHPAPRHPRLCRHSTRWLVEPALSTDALFLRPLEVVHDVLLA
jgi:lactate dehydrogenase-like 2-hydroxyacid dehydrogenase